MAYVRAACWNQVIPRSFRWLWWSGGERGHRGEREIDVKRNNKNDMCCQPSQLSRPLFVSYLFSTRSGSRNRPPSLPRHSIHRALRRCIVTRTTCCSISYGADTMDQPGCVVDQARLWPRSTRYLTNKLDKHNLNRTTQQFSSARFQCPSLGQAAVKYYCSK